MGKRKQKAAVAEQRRLTDRAHEIVEQVMPRVEETYDHARVRAHDVVATAREQAPPLIEKGRATATEKASAAATKASVAGSAAGVAAGKAAAKAKGAAAEKVAVVRPKPQPKKGGKLKKLLLIGLLGAIGGVVFKKLKGGSQDNWQSTYVPTPPPPAPSEQSTTGGSAGVSGSAAAAGTSTAPPSSTDTTDDPAGADPAEALADATDEPHDATTPDAPAEVTELIEKPKG